MAENAMTDVLMYTSEEDRQKALSGLPEEPPVGTSNVDEWLDGVREQKERIEAAEIKPGEPTPEPSSPKEPAPPPPEESPPQEEDVLSFNLKRSELPEILRHYKTGPEIIKQAGHARTYANTAEQTMGRLAQEKAELEARLKGMEERKPEPPPAPAPAPISPPPASHASELADSLATLQRMADEDLVDASSVKKMMGAAAKEIAAAQEGVRAMRQNYVSYREQAEAKQKDLESRLDGIKSNIDGAAQATENQRQQAEVAKELGTLQGEFKELATSKAVTGDPGKDVESAVAQFADRVALVKYGAHTRDWAQRNAIVNAWLRGDPEYKAFAQNNGITPESVGMTEADVQAYATLANVDAHMRGLTIDETTGAYSQLLNPITRQTVNFPSYKAAYRHMLDSSGVLQERHRQQLADAEKKGQTALLEAEQRRDTSGKILGSVGESSPNNVGEGVSTEEAARFLQDPDLAEKIEYAARQGNRSVFRQYCKALVALGETAPSADPMWPEEKNV